MVILFVVLAAFLLVVTTIFSIQNAAPVVVWFFNRQFSASLAIVIFLSVLVGMVLMGLLQLWVRLNRSFRRRRAEKKKGQVDPPNSVGRTVS